MNRFNPLKSWTLALALAITAPAYAGEPVEAGTAASTDRLIVKYRDLSASARPDARAMSLALTAAARRRMSLRPLAISAEGIHVLQLDRCAPVAHVAALAEELQASDVRIEYAHPDRSDGLAEGMEMRSACEPPRRSQYAVVQ